MNVHCGFRYFVCPNCNAHWREACRDYSTESSSKCVNGDCMTLVSPKSAHSDPSLPTDWAGNLIENNTYPAKTIYHFGAKIKP